jgi:capsular exopolysaccharide synthesis family protein
MDFEAEDSIDIKAFLLKCYRHWYLFALFLVLSLSAAIIINKAKEPEFKVSAFILIHDEENPLDPQNFIGSSLYGNPFKLQNEIGILQSKSLTRRTLQTLNFFTSYYREDRFRSVDIYDEVPFSLVTDTLFEQPLGVKFKLRFINDTLFSIQAKAKEAISHDFRSNSDTRIFDFTFSDTVSFGELCGNQYCRFRILPNFHKLSQISQNKSYSFQFNSLSMLVGKFRIEDIEATKNSSILRMSVRCSNVRQGADYLNKLTEIFLIKGIERDDKIAETTIQFIDDQLKGISDSLRYSEDKLQKFRSARGATNIDYQAQQTYEQMEGLEDQLAELIVKSKYYSYLKEYLLKNNRVSDLIAPSSMDINDPLLNNLIIELTRLYSERTELSFNTIKDNPYIQSLELKINDIKANLIENIDNIIKATEISIGEIESRINDIDAAIGRLPESQREFLVIERKFKLNDAIYTYLLTKRSEVQISKASNLPSNEILDRAETDDYVQVSPNQKMNFLISLLIGILAPSLLIYLKDYFRNKVTDKSDLQSITNLPVIGNILHSSHKSARVVDEMPASVVSESFRSLRTNFEFLSQQERNIVMITSIIKGEGKSFTCINLGTAFAQGNKKVVIIDFDLRRAKIKHYLDIEANTGLSRYLSNQAVLKDIIFHSGIRDLDVIPSGPLPPNPLDLIASERTAALFTELQKVYDVILLDSPPVALVSDALLLLKYANVKLIVVRQNYTPRNLLVSVLNDIEKRNISSLSLVMNDEKAGLNGYGYGYGYAYGYGHHDEKKSIKSKIASIFR